jgi:PPOX class probable F420-dependent enzyme
MELATAHAFAAERRNGVLVTLKRDGRPQLSNIVYQFADGTFRISITSDRAKYVNLRRDPRASIYVGRDDFGAYVVFEGDAEVSAPARDPHDASADALVALYRSIAGEHPDWEDYRRAMVADNRAVVTVKVTNAYGMANR